MGEQPLVIDVIDNGGQWTHREWRVLRYLGVDTEIHPNDTPLDGLREIDGLVLSGGAARVGLSNELGNCGAYMDLDVPILGICAGHQFMAGFYGGQTAEAPKPEFGAASISLVDGGGQIFEGTPEEQTVWESHNDEVTEAPPGFTITAHSHSCKVQGMETPLEIALVCSSTLRSTIPSTVHGYSRTSLVYANGPAGPAEA